MTRYVHSILIGTIAVFLALGTIAIAKPPAKRRSPTCQQHALQLIKRGYAEGGMKLLQVRGPFTWNEAFFDDKGNPGIRPRVAYLVRYAWDAEFRGRNRPGTVLLIGTCSEGSRSRLRDVDRSGIVDLSDLLTVKR